MADDQPFRTQALVARGPVSAGQWALEDVELRPLREDELLVEVVASGICHTDLHCGGTAPDAGVPGVFYPRVLGHEGAGYVRRVGAAVTHARPGDPVLLSFAYCGACHVCRTGPPSHCTTFFDINFVGEPVFRPVSSASAGSDDDAAAEKTGTPIAGRFFGQSSFARHTIADAKSVVNVAGLGLTRADLKLLAPLGCGLNTGSGTVVNVARAGADDAVAIIGLGGVGLAAVMAARHRGCRHIIGIDRVASRLALARELGATAVVDSRDLSAEALVAAVQAATDDGLGASVAIDTSAHPPLVEAAVAFTRYMGRVIQVGTGLPDAHLSLHMQSFMVSGKQYFGAVQGHSRTRDDLPRLIQWWRDGKFPIEKLVRFYPFAEFADAVKVMGNGSVVKPIMYWPEEDEKEEK